LGKKGNEGSGERMGSEKEKEGREGRVRGGEGKGEGSIGGEDKGVVEGRF
jgi:hypothetical protein